MKKFNYKFEDFIGIFDNVFSVGECNEIIKSFETYHESGYSYTRSFF